MKPCYCLLLSALLTSCFSARKAPNSSDPALLLDRQDRQLTLTSANSAQQTRIIRQTLSGDTLLLWYRTGAFVSATNTVHLAPQVRFVKCAGRVYRLAEAGNALEQL